MTKYNAHKTAYWSDTGIGGWYLIKRGQTRRRFWEIFPNNDYFLPLTLDWEADEITPEYREILLDAIDDNKLIPVWVRMKRVMSNAREPVLDEYIRRMTL